MFSRMGLLSVVVLLAKAAHAELKTESFDRDPGWIGSNNRIVPDRMAKVEQDFGYDAAKGAVGGRLTRAAKAAFYATPIGPRTFNDKLSASGTFTLTKSGGASAVFFGWFNANHLPEGSGRPPSSFGLELSGENSGGRLAVRAHTATNLSAGTFITRFEPYRTKEEAPIKRPTSIRNDGTRYTWSMSYDPDGAGGNGQGRFTIKSDRDTADYFEGKEFTFDLPPGFKQAGATFDRFGLLNGTKPGGPLTVYFDDVTFDGQTVDFAKDPGWAGSGNRETYETKIMVGAHDFGFSAATNHAGGAKPGEVGGDLWRSGKYATYADTVGPLSGNDRLEARGRVVLLVGAPDSDMLFGWFSSASKNDDGPFIGVHVGGPTRIGHYFRPRGAQQGPILTPGKPFPISIVYDPAANDGFGAVTATLGDETVTHNFKQRQKPADATFDRFGLFTNTAGGQLVRIYFDDLTYTAKRPAP